MSQITIVIAIIVISFVSLSYAQEDQKLSVTTSHNFYENGDVVVISGQAKPIIKNVPVIIQIIADGRLIDVAQIVIAKDGNFSHTLIAEGLLWKNSGDYFVKASYGLQSVESRFEFKASETIGVVKDVFEVDAGEYGTFDIQYAITGGIIEHIKVDPTIFGLVIEINSNENGKLVVELPREHIDAIDQNGANEMFIIVIDGSQVTYIEELDQNSETRKISFNFQQGDTRIEVIGTRVIPEFGSLTATVLVTIIATIIITMRTKIFPKRLLEMR